jgi:hypothetical protein
MHIKLILSLGVSTVETNEIEIEIETVLSAKIFFKC